MKRLFDTLGRRFERGPADLQLQDGSRVAVMGGGPAGSFFSYFLLDMARRVGLDVQVDIYEPRDFTAAGSAGCNMCGGIVSESLVQTLAAEGINLPATVIQRGIDSYRLHTDAGSVHIATPLQEKRIGAVHRGGGPRGVQEAKWGGLDAFLQALAVKQGARVIRARVDEIGWVDGHPRLKTKNDPPQTYDLLAVAVGVNSAALKLFSEAELDYQPPATTKTLIREYYLGQETIEKHLGNSMHVFLLNLPRLEFAAIIPKGDYVTVCLLGEEIDAALVQSFLSCPEVKRCMPPGWRAEAHACQCSPRINVRGAARQFGDRIVFVGDSGTTRLYKDGIGAAYRTAKAAATTAVLQGVSAAAFQACFAPTCQRIETDNAIGKIMFAVTRQIQQKRFARRAVLRMTAGEQHQQGRARRMSTVLWDMFTGSAPYREIFLRAAHPGFVLRLLWNLGAALWPWANEKSHPQANTQSGLTSASAAE